MTPRPLLAAALALPILWLAGSIWMNEQALARAREWRIPIEGYDPRDPLRGQYVQFTFGWTMAGDPALCEKPQACDLCLSEVGKTLVASAQPHPAQCPHRIDPALSNLELRPAFRPGESARFQGRIFVSETSAPELEDRLREGPMVLVAMLTPDGRLINRRLEPAG